MMKIKLASLIILALHFHAFAQVVPKGNQLKPIYVNGRWGYADSGGRVVIVSRFDAALPFTNGIARVGVLDEELPEIGASPNRRFLTNASDVPGELPLPATVFWNDGPTVPIVNRPARHEFSLGTCSACHHSETTTANSNDGRLTLISSSTRPASYLC